MKKFIIIAILTVLPFAAFCQEKWIVAYNDIQKPETVYDNITIDKKACTITKDGKTFKLYGKIKFVEAFADIKVQIVSSFPDIKIKFVDNWADSCGKFIISDNWPELKVQIVTSFPDLKVSIVENWPGF